MDKIFFLEKTYKDLKDKNIKGIDLGLLFLDKFFKEAKNLEYASQSKNKKVLNVFNFEKNEFFQIEVDEFLFQHQLQFLYREFVVFDYFNKFKWHINFAFSVKKTLTEEFNYDSKTAIDFIIVLVSNCFVATSDGLNKFSYKEVFYKLEKSFTIVGVDLEESFELSFKILDGLLKDGLIYFSKNIFDLKNTFHLSDYFMDIVFNLNSFFISPLFGDSYIKYNSKFNLNNLSKSIDFFHAKWHTRPFFLEIKSKMINKYPKLMFELENYSNLDFNYEFPEDFSEDEKNIVKYFFYKKILLNEYCFQLISISCFDVFYLKSNFKNVLNTHKDFFIY